MASLTKTFVLCSRHITSQNDGQVHFISCRQLAQLYGLHWSEFETGTTPDDEAYWIARGLTPLYPRHLGDYREHLDRLRRALAPAEAAARASSPQPAGPKPAHLETEAKIEQLILETVRRAAAEKANAEREEAEREQRRKQQGRVARRIQR